MIVINTTIDIRLEIERLRRTDKTIGFVPTMGCLHEGHISLVERSKKENDITIVSIFVNPTQFNDAADLRNYPRTPEKDIEKLKAADCNILFMPSEKEIYPVTDERKFDFGELDKILEGEFRKDHFNGVAQVVSKLFDIVKPDKAYFGQKDFQQLAIINQLVKQLRLDVEVIGCPIRREINGLAMSSRNELLSPEAREETSIIYKSLKFASAQIEKMTLIELKDRVIGLLNSNKNIKVDYVEFVDSENLKIIKTREETKNITLCVAVYFNKIRLIDNINFNN